MSDELPASEVPASDKARELIARTRVGDLVRVTLRGILYAERGRDWFKLADVTIGSTRSVSEVVGTYVGHSDEFIRHKKRHCIKLDPFCGNDPTLVAGLVYVPTWAVGSYQKMRP